MNIVANKSYLDIFSKLSELCQKSKIGKKLPNALYVHIDSLPFLDPLLQEYEQFASNIYPYRKEVTLIKFHLQSASISYLYYPDFDCNPHPEIHKSRVINLGDRKVNLRVYQNADNPPILHRKETFVTNEYPLYEEFCHLTKIEDTLGLLDNSRFIGNKHQWQQLLKDHRLDFEDNHLVCQLHQQKEQVMIDRHKAALVRHELSKPVRSVLELGLFEQETTFFDYGCGHGGDIQRIKEKEYQSSGWDPFYLPNAPLQSADIVNLGYVINVIENVSERRNALINAYNLAKEILIVSAQILVHDRERGLVAYSDGIITEKNTFQKYYSQDELKNYIDQVLNTNSVAIDLGIYLVFKNPDRANEFYTSRYRSRLSRPKILTPLKRFEDYKELLNPLMNFYLKRGRLPVRGEYDKEGDLIQEFGSIKRAFKVILQVTSIEEWEAIADKRRQEILIYLALSNFKERPSIRKLPQTLKNDIKVLFSNYQAACFLADQMLLTLRNLDLIKSLCQEFGLGIILQNAFLIHLSSLDSLPSLVRLFEGCASNTIGRLAHANVVKFHFNTPRISYLYYPNFDTESKPKLQSSLSINLINLEVHYRDYSQENNPPFLDHKSKLGVRC